MPKYRLVKFRDGGYGVAKGRWVFTEFVDLVNPEYCWSEDASYFKDCVGTRDKAEEVLKLLKTPLYTFVD